MSLSDAEPDLRSAAFIALVEIALGRRALRGALAALLVAVCAAPATARRHDAVPSTGLSGIAFDHTPPDVAIDTGAGAQPLSARFGRPLVIVFWASWCGPCRDEIDQFTAARARYGDGLGILTVSAEPASVAAAYLAARGLDAAIVTSGGARLARAFGVGAIPVTVVLGTGGAVAHVSVGELDPGELAAALAALRPGTLTPRAGSGTVGEMPGTPTR